MLRDGRGWKALVAPLCSQTSSPASRQAAASAQAGLTALLLPLPDSVSPRIPEAASEWRGECTGWGPRLGMGGGERTSKGTSSTWKERWEHSLDLEVRRLLQGAISGRLRKLYWRTKTPGFFVVRDSLASFLSCYGPPRPQNLTPTAPKVPSSFADLTPGLASRAASCPPSGRVTAPQRSASSDAPSGQGGSTPPRTARGSHLRPGADSPGPPCSPPPLPPAARLHQSEPRSPPPRRCAKPSPSPASGEFRSSSWP